MISLFTQVIKPVYLHARYVSSRLKDRRLGIITTDECVARELGQDFSQYCSIHRAVPFTGIHRLLRRLDPGSSDALLDFGCGAGRVICLAAQYPFSRIIGIDIDEKVYALAERNARTLLSGAVSPELVCTDATTYRVPDDITVVFLYNPFDGEVLRSALTRVLESYDRTPRRLRLAYVNPREHVLLMSMERFREIDRLWISWRPGAEWARTQMVRFYEVKPRSDVDGAPSMDGA